MMKLKSAATVALLVICVASIYLIFLDGNQRNLSAEQSVQSKSSQDATPAEDRAITQDKTASDHIIAYYFHTARRCTTCRTIEAYTKQALEEKFEDALKSGNLEWRVLDVSIPENKHFVDDYQLVSQSVVLSAVQDGKQTRWKNLNKVWQLVRNKDAFFSYIQNETADFMK